MMIVPLNLSTIFSYNNLIGIISNSIMSFNNIYLYLSTNNTNKTIQKYLHDIELLDIKVKLEFINNWLESNGRHIKHENDFDIVSNNNNIISINRPNIIINSKQSTNFYLVFTKIKEISTAINNDIIIIENKINKYLNAWSKYVYNLDLSNEICRLKHNCTILDSRIQFLHLL
jgi:hypothetical protein